MGRGDRRGATRLMFVVLALSAVGWAFGEHHVATLWEFGLFNTFAGLALLGAGLLAALYLALEPFARRRWPQQLVSWTRLLHGDWRDPLVGRDVLAGCATGVAGACLVHLAVVAPTWVRRPQEVFFIPGHPLIGLSALFTGISQVSVVGMAVALMMFFLLVFLRNLFPRETVGTAVWFVLFAAVLMAASEPRLATLWLITPLAILYTVIVFLALTRAGWLAFFVGRFVYDILTGYPLTFHSSAWYAPIGYAGLLVIAAMALYGLWTSLGGRIMPELADEPRAARAS